MAHAMAMETERIRTDVVEVQEYPHLARSYMVQAVPKTVINRTLEVLGAVPEQTLLHKVLTAAGREDLLAVARVSRTQEPVGGPTTVVGGSR